MIILPINDSITIEFIVGTTAQDDECQLVLLAHSVAHLIHFAHKWK